MKINSETAYKNNIRWRNKYTRADAIATVQVDS